MSEKAQLLTIADAIKRQQAKVNGIQSSISFLYHDLTAESRILGVLEEMEMEIKRGRPIENLETRLNFLVPKVARGGEDA